MIFKKFVSGLLACAMVVTSLFTGNVATVKAETKAAESTALQAGDYYIMNTSTGKYLDSGGTWGTHACLFDYGQLMTVSSASGVTPQDGGVYNIKTYIKAGGYLGKNAFVDNDKAEERAMTITSCGKDEFTIANDEGKYLSAKSGSIEADFLAVENPGADQKWRFLTREQLIENIMSGNTPADVTKLMYDPGCSQFNTYRDTKWNKGVEGAPGSGGYNGGGGEISNYCLEYFAKAFDFYQVLDDVPNGVYDLSLYGFYRADKADQKAPQYYANGESKPLKAIETDASATKVDGIFTTDRNGKFVPDNMGEAARCFLENAYRNEPVTVEVTDHKLRIGLKMETAGSWVLWDNFKLELKRLITDDELAAREVIKVIEQIGEVSLKPSCKEKIDAARAAYNALTEDGKGFVTNYDMLTAAEEEYADLLENGGEGALDRVAAEEAVETINAIGKVVLTDDCKAKIEAARAAYEALTDAQKAYVTTEQLKVLTDAETAYDQLAADEVTVKIDEIGVVELTDACKNRIEAARAAYEALTDAQKALVEEEALEQLVNAETQFPQLIPEQPILANGDCYVVNKKTGRLLNGGNNYGTKASALTYGQLVTVALMEGDTYHYSVDSHISNGGDKHFLTADAWTDGVATPLVIAKSANGSFTIANAKGEYLTANDEDTILAFGRRTDYSEWNIFTREQYIEAALGAVTEENPVDVTSLILDSNFSRNNTYFAFKDGASIGKWQGSAVTKGGKNGGNNQVDHQENYCVESYHSAFDSYQTLTGIPNGTYELSVQGFYRADQGSQGPAVFYANEVEKALMAIADGGKAEATGGWTNNLGTEDAPNYVPNGMGDASLCFTAGGYVNEALTVTVTDHTLKVGAKTTDKNNWVLWDGFNLKLKSVADSEYAERAAAKIDAIGEVELTETCKAKIDAARAAYNALTDAQKALIAEKEAVLTAAETKYANLQKVAEVEEKIDEIGTYTFTTVCKKRIDAAKAAYETLTEDQKALLNAEKLQALTDAETAFQKDFDEKGQSGLNQSDADATVALIDAIGEVELTETCKAKIDAAKEVYDALNADAKALVAAEKVTVLENAITKYEELENAVDQAVVDEVIAKIDAIGTVAFTSDCRLAIKEARTAYDSLSVRQQSLMPPAKLTLLTSAETTYDELVTANAPVVAAGDYYIVNVLTGKYLNANTQMKASVRSYGQLMTVAVSEDDKASCTIDSHYKEGTNNHYLDAEGFLNGETTALKIEKSKEGKFNITNADDGFLTASAKNGMVMFTNHKSEGSEWEVLSREELIEKLSAGVTEENPADLTSLLSDPGFDKNNDYFSNYSYSSELKALKKSEQFSNVECYHEAFDFSQTIENVPNGVYELSVQGFYRADEGSEASTVYYLNETEQDLKTIESDGKPEQADGWSTLKGTVYVPNSMEDASKCFAVGAYVNDSITVTVTNHTLKIGVKTTDTKNWVIWDNFNLKLKKAELKDQAIADVEAKIDAIGTVEFTKECKDRIDAARAAYDALTDEQKEQVSDAKLRILEDAEEEYERLKQEETPSEGLKERLKNAIAAADEDPLEEAAYSVESLKAYNDALAALKEVSTKNDATKTEIEAALQNFNAAIEGLVVNEEYKPTEKQVQELATAVGNAVKLNPKDYLADENWATFQKKLAWAQSISNRINVTKKQVDKAISDLQKAIANLKRAVDKTALNAAIAGCANLRATDYNAATWNVFQTALNAAKAVAAKGDATQAEVNAALANLNAKKAGLKRNVLVSSIKLSAANKNIMAGKKTTVKANVLPANATNKAVTLPLRQRLMMAARK